MQIAVKAPAVTIDFRCERKPFVQLLAHAALFMTLRLTVKCIKQTNRLLVNISSHITRLLHPEMYIILLNKQTDGFKNALNCVCVS